MLLRCLGCWPLTSFDNNHHQPPCQSASIFVLWAHRVLPYVMSEGSAEKWGVDQSTSSCRIEKLNVFLMICFTAGDWWFALQRQLHPVGVAPIPFRKDGRTWFWMFLVFSNSLQLTLTHSFRFPRSIFLSEGSIKATRRKDLHCAFRSPWSCRHLKSWCLRSWPSCSWWVMEDGFGVGGGVRLSASWLIFRLFYHDVKQTFMHKM